MTSHRRTPGSADGDHGAHFEHLASGHCHESNPLMAEYRLLYEEYCALKRRVKLLDRENNSLIT
ncbi:MAG: hypothetical protein WA003_03840, partial [Desulfuromonadaceae bacterium]